MKNKKIFPLLFHSVNILFQNKAILYPFFLNLFVQLFILEILYFAPRYPLNVFFGPLIRKLWGESFLHFPMNFFLLPKLYQYAVIPVNIFLSSFFIAVAINIIVHINNDKKIYIRKIFKESLQYYVHVVVVAVIFFLLIGLLFAGYEAIYNRAAMIRSEEGKFYLIKRLFMDGAPYFNVLLSVFASTVLAYVMPIIVIDNKKAFSAILLNFKVLWGSFWFTFFVILLPTLLYMPVLLLRNLFPLESALPISNEFPEIRVVIMVFSILVMTIIDAIIYTTVSMYYLMRKEEQ